jgi:ABC-2 type transport system ATP-binding protein
MLLPPPTTALTVTDLVKDYPGGVRAVDGISFEVPAGETFGLLGPNGAGKSTTLGILTTLVRPSAGTAIVAGHDVTAHPLDVRREIGVVFQDSVLDPEFTGEENLRLHARLWRVADAGRRVDEGLASVGLTERASAPVSTYSGGMKRRLEIARALLSRPRILFLDEPTLGLDPVVRAELWETIRTLTHQRGVTVVLSTHYLEEAQGVCDRVAIVDRGRIIALDRPGALVAQLGAHVLEVETAGTPDRVLRALPGAGTSLGRAFRSGPAIAAASDEPVERLTALGHELGLAALGATRITVRPATLNDVLLHLTAPLAPLPAGAAA